MLIWWSIRWKTFCVKHPMTDWMAVATDIAGAWGRLSQPLRLVVNRENAVFEARFESGVRGALRLHREV